MSKLPCGLEGLRRRIDEIDDRLQDLLIARLEIVASVAAHKRGQRVLAAHQPGREAEIIRRLVRRRGGAFPTATLVRMWRELLAATVRLQSSFAVAVYAPPQAPGYWDLARDHYGSQTPMVPYPTVSQVIAAVIMHHAAVGVLPMPIEDEAEPWWRQLMLRDDNAPHVIARLPFGAPGNARSSGAEALAIGRGIEQPTGQDRTLFITESAADVSRGCILSTFSALGLSCTFITACEDAGAASVLIEIDGFVEPADPRLDQLRSQLGRSLHRLLRFGSYAVPLPAAVFSAEPEPATRAPVTVQVVAGTKG